MILYIYLLSIIFSFIEASVPNFIMHPYTRGTGPVDTIDTTSIQVYFALNAWDIRDEKTYCDYFCLEIGKKTNKFYSYRGVEAEERRNKWMKEHHVPSGSGVRIVPEGNYNGWSEYQYSEWFISGSRLTEYSCFPMYLGKYNCFHEEDYPRQKWTILSDTLSICGFICQQATCHFSGRDFTAWFCPKIPMKYGPWKFGGLPGLILKVYDKDKFYSFDCVKIERKKKLLQKMDYKSYHRMERGKLLKIQRQIHEDISVVFGKPDENPKKIITYQPLELE